MQIQEPELKSIFSEVGTVKALYIMRKEDRISAKVKFETDKAAADAIETYSSHNAASTAKGLSNRLSE